MQQKNATENGYYMSDQGYTIDIQEQARLLVK